MKKKISVLLIALVAMLSLTACGKFTCDICGQESTGKKHKIEVFDEKYTVCDDCNRIYEELGDLYEGFTEGVSGAVNSLLDAIN